MGDSEAIWAMRHYISRWMGGVNRTAVALSLYCVGGGQWDLGHYIHVIAT